MKRKFRVQKEPRKYLTSARTHTYKEFSNRWRIIGENLSGAKKFQYSLQRSGSDYYVWTPMDGLLEWKRFYYKFDTLSSTGMRAIKGMDTWNVYPWTAVANANSTYAAGSWIQNISGSNTNFGLQYYTLASDNVQFSVTGNGSLYVEMVNGTDRGYCYVTINGSTALVNNLPTSGANKYIDAYAASNIATVTLVATGLTQGTYTIKLQRSTTEKNASSTGFRLFPDSYALVGSTVAAPYTAPTSTTEGWIPRVMTSIGGVFSVRTGTTPATQNSFTTSAMTATTDFLYIGNSLNFSAVGFTLSVPNTGGGTMTAQYWNGSAWTAFSAITNGYTDTSNGLSQSGVLKWVQPSTMTTTTVNSIAAYWVRLSWSNNTSAMTVTSGLQDVINSPKTENVIAQAPGSQMEYAGNFTPPAPNNTIQSFGGELHGGETNAGLTFLIDGVSTTLIDGQAVAANYSIQAVQTMNIVHPTAGTVGSGTLTHNWSGHTLSVAYKSSFSTPVTLNPYFYLCMYPAIWYSALISAYGFTKARLQGVTDANSDIVFATAGNNTFNGKIKGSATLYYNDITNYFCVVSHQNNIAQCLNWLLDTTNKCAINNNPAGVTVPGGSSAISKYYEDYMETPNTVSAAAGYSLIANNYYTFGKSSSNPITFFN